MFLDNVSCAGLATETEPLIFAPLIGSIVTGGHHEGTGFFIVEEKVHVSSFLGLG